MKNKTLLLRFCIGTLMLGVLTLFSTNAWAQPPTWDAPTYYGEVPVSGTAYYIYNVGSDAFLNRGGEWTAGAVITSHTKDAASGANITWTCVNSAGEWTFQYTNNGTPAGNHYLFQIPDGGGWIYTDNSNSPDNHWNITETDAVAHIYSIQVRSSAGYYNPSEFLGALSTSRVTNKGRATEVRYNEAASSNTQWKFVSQANYDLYQAKVLLDKYMNYATKITGGPDISTYVATYNSDVTADINTAAAALLAELAPTDVTSSILNPSFEDAPYDNNWTNNGFVQNNWTTPIGFTKDGAMLVEKWTGSPGPLAASSITQTVSGLADGIYSLSFSAHAVTQKVDGWNVGSANPLHTGAYLVAGTSNTEVSAGGEYSVDYVSVSSGSLTIGYELKGTIACNWTAFDNFKLFYFGEGPSNDASLSDITLSVGSLVQDFDPTITSYSVTVPKGTTSVDVSATKSDSSATITSGTGTITLTDGEGSTDIMVTAEDGSTTKTYTLVFMPIELKHSYTFEDGTADDVIGDADGTLVGGASVSGGQLVLDANGQYLSFDPSELGLSAYTNMTMEFIYTSKVGANDGHWNWAAYFGGDWGANSIMVGLRTWNQYAFVKNNAENIWVGNADDGGIHHVVAIMTESTLSLFADGTKIGETAAPNNALEEIHAWLGRAHWSDPTWQGKIEEFNIYDGIMPGDSIAARADVLQNSNANLTALSASAGTLYPAFDKSITKYALVIPNDLTSIDISATPQIVGALIKGLGTINISGGSKSINVTVTSLDGTFTKTYTLDLITEDANCYKGVNSEYRDLTNIVPDPEMTDITKFKGWGSREIVYGLEAYCGISAAKVAGHCGGSLDVDLDETGMIKPNTTYHMRAMVYVEGSEFLEDGNFKVGFWGTGMPGSVVQTKVLNEWHMIEMEFTTGGTIGGDIGMYFNSCEGLNGVVGYIDNWELYDIETDNTDLESLSSPQAVMLWPYEPGTNSYRMKYGINDSIVEINAVPRYASQTVTGDGTFEVNGNTFMARIKVKSSSGAENEIWVIVEPDLHDATLKSITPSVGVMNPEFQRDITEYRIFIPEGTTSIDIEALTNDSAATVAGTGTYETLDSITHVELLVTSRDGTTQQTYSLQILNKPDALLMHSYTFEEGTYTYSTVYDQVGTLNGTIGGSKIKIADGKATVSGATQNSDGWISLNGSKLALHTYSEITIEAYLETGSTLNTGYTMLAYFGTSTPGNGCFWIQPTRASTETRVETNNGSTTINAIKSGYEVDDGLVHYLAVVLTGDTLLYYLDGEVLAQASTGGADFISTIGTDVANIFRGVDGWPDPNYNVSLHEFNIYEGALEADTIAQRANAFLGQRDASLASLTVDAGTMSPTFDGGKTSYFVTIPTGADTINVEAVPNNVNATVVGDGAVDVSSGSAMATVVVTSEDGSIEKTYTIEFKPAVELSLRHSYTFEDGTAADVIGDLDGTLNGSKISIADGKCTVSGATTPTDGYISLDAAKLALNTYDAITVEAYIESFSNANTGYTMLCYFGNNTGGSKSFWFQPTTSGTASRVAVDNTNPKAEYAVEVDDGNLHHVVAILTLDVLKYYLDGELVAETTTGGNYISTIDNVIAQIFKGPNGWTDPNYNSSLEEFNIYNGEMDAGTVSERANDYLASSSSELSALTVDGISVPGFDPGTLTYDVELADDAGAVVAAVAKYENSTVEITQASAIPGTATVIVTSGDSSSTSTYTINFMQKPTSVDDVTADFLENPGFNIECNYLVGADSINLATDNTGASSMEITGWSMGEGTEWRASATFECGYTGILNGGMIPSLDSEGESGEEKGVLGIQASWGGHVTYYQEVTLPAGTYILKNMTYNSSATTQAGSSLFGWVPNEGSMILSSKASFASGVWEKDSVQFILTEETTGKIQVGVQAIGAGSADNAKVFFDYVKLYKTNANSFVVDTESMSLDDVDNTTAVFNITGSGSNFEDVTFTVPAGLSLSVDGVEVTTISGADVTADGGVDVTVTFDGSANIFDGEIVIMSGSLSESVSVVASADLLCFEPLYTDRENLIVHPFMNSLDSYTGWGNRTIYTGEDAYCGASCYYADGQEVCWPNGASLDYAITGMKSDTWYRLKFMVKTVDGSFTINTNGWYVNGEKENVMEINTNGEWAVFDTTLQTGTLTGGQNLFFNNCEGATGMKAYLDNYELYEVDTPTSAIDWKEASIQVYPTISSREFNVKFDGVQPGVIRVFNMYGQVVLDRIATSALEKVHIQHAGMYLIQVETGGTNKVVKVLKTE